MNLKKRFLQIGFLSILIFFTSCGTGNKQKEAKSENEAAPEQHQADSTSGMYDQHNSLADNFKHKNAVILNQVYQVKESSERKMEAVIEAYFAIKKALDDDNLNTVKETTGSMIRKVNEVKPDKLKGEGLDAWRNHQSLYLDKLKELRHIEGMENKRSYFAHLSEIMYCTIKSFGLKKQDLYVAYCPMAFDNIGAYWISESKTIRNPYLATKMPNCGEIKEVL
ncbi:MAG: DUF3347 domain-containing protein [Bacteroidales bacterium]|nr:DUF3347 domain-containing protein [Bacteroidales bacterium]MCF8338352.1 DUF3347 domain-containing protein [Bacteroidales bacterium]